jgi:hypothetical protein
MFIVARPVFALRPTYNITLAAAKGFSWPLDSGRPGIVLTSAIWFAGFVSRAPTHFLRLMMNRTANGTKY